MSPPKVFADPEKLPCQLSRTSSWGRSTGSTRSRTWSNIVKIAVVAPIPSASVTTAVTANPGDFHSCRHAYFRSPSISVLLTVTFSWTLYSVLLHSQRLHRIDTRCPQRGDQSSDNAYGDQRHRRQSE